MSTREALTNWAAAWGLGGAINALDEIQKADTDNIPGEVREAGFALAEALEALDLCTSKAPLAADVWREEP
ncbi:hypothetical protein [Paenarthrobacter ureafaciens]|uniref:hypothetical protein n=1 Tax=Paenarthrobacter ureafaciens TaxID=37931 RepID=UPI0034641B8F